MELGLVPPQRPEKERPVSAKAGEETFRLVASITGRQEIRAALQQRTPLITTATSDR